MLLGLAAYFAVSAGLSLIPPETPLMEEYIEASSSLTAGRYPFVEILATVLGAPILEEIVFRGLIYGNFKKAMRPGSRCWRRRCSLVWCTVSSCGPGSPSCSRSPWA